LKSSRVQAGSTMKFGVKPTPLREALRETFRDSRYSQIALEF